MVEFNPLGVLVTFAYLIFSIAAGTGSLAWAYARAGFGITAHWILFFGLLWSFASLQRWRWVSVIAFLLSVLLGIIGIWVGISIGWMFNSTIYTLIAWNLTDLNQKLRMLNQREDRRGIERRHIARISLLVLVSLMIGSLLLFWRNQWTTEWGLFLIANGTAGLAQFMRWNRN